MGVYPPNTARSQGMTFNHAQYHVVPRDFDQRKCVDGAKEGRVPLSELPERQLPTDERMHHEVPTVQPLLQLGGDGAALQEFNPHGRVDQNHERRRGAISRLLRGARASGAEPASAASSRLAA